MMLMPEVTNPNIQEHMANRYEDIMDQYYAIVDELVQKLDDLGIKGKIPDFDVYEFEFLTQWEKGLVSSSQVVTVLANINTEAAARTRLTRKLLRFMDTQDQLICDYVKHSLKEINEKLVPDYAIYLNLLKTWFKKLAGSDSAQMKVTWLQQKIDTDDSVSKMIEDMTFNQAVRQISTFVANPLDTGYFIGPNIVAFENEFKEGDKEVHWIFGPESYIDIIKLIYNVKKGMSLMEEKEHILSLIKDYAS